FQEELEELKRRILEMGGLAEEQVRAAVKGLVERDAALIDRCLAGDEPINAMHIEIDNRSFTLLALFQPMAADRYIRLPPVKPLIDIPRMATIAQGMLRDALDSFVRRDVELARRVLDQDDALDA